LALNWYGPGTITVPLSPDEEVTLRQETEYPRQNEVRLSVDPSSPKRFTLKLRIPGWSAETRVRVNGEEIGGVHPGQYLALDREWRPGDAVEVEFDFGLRTWIGGRECEGKVSVYRGPLLLAYDRAFNDLNEDEFVLSSPEALETTVVPVEGRLAPYVLVALKLGETSLRLCDFGSAGDRGTAYHSWLPLSR
jgi:DUF1680 family protein